MPGKGQDIVYVTTPEDARHLLSMDGPMPILPAFDKIETIRKKDLKHIFQTPGLLSHGESWAEARKAVQQDLMRPKSALFYIEELNETTEELVAKILKDLDANGETTKINDTLQRYALEATGIMFIG